MKKMEFLIVVALGLLLLGCRKDKATPQGTTPEAGHQPTTQAALGVVLVDVSGTRSRLTITGTEGSADILRKDVVFATGCSWSVVNRDGAQSL